MKRSERRRGWNSQRRRSHEVVRALRGRNLAHLLCQSLGRRGTSSLSTVWSTAATQDLSDPILCGSERVQTAALGSFDFLFVAEESRWVTVVPFHQMQPP